MQEAGLQDGQAGPVSTERRVLGVVGGVWGVLGLGFRVGGCGVLGGGGGLGGCGVRV